MPDPVQYRITVSPNASEIVRSLQTMPDWMTTAVVKAMDEQNLYTVSHIQTKYLSFPKHEPPVAIGCRARTGLLRTSLHASQARVSGNAIISTIGSNVKYAAAQEFGADIPAQTIVPKNGKALRFMIGDRIIFAKKVKLPARRIEGRAFVQNGIRERLPQYSRAISKAIVESWNNNHS